MHVLDPSGAIMKPLDMSKSRIVDLSYRVEPALKKANGKYYHGEPFFGRMIHLEEFMFAPQDNVRMHWIRGETHVGTHLETELKVSETGRDVASIPLDSFVGEAVVVDCSRKKANEPITPADFEKAGVGTGERVLILGPVPEVSPVPYLSSESAKWLVKHKTKLLALQNCMEYLPEEIHGHLPEDKHNAVLLFKSGIVRVDAITNLEKLKRKRVFLIALPLNFGRLEASWTRAIAIEEK
jgi:arylformamidase